MTQPRHVCGLPPAALASTVLYISSLGRLSFQTLHDQTRTVPHDWSMQPLA